MGPDGGDPSPWDQSRSRSFPSCGREPSPALYPIQILQLSQQRQYSLENLYAAFGVISSLVVRLHSSKLPRAPTRMKFTSPGIDRKITIYIVLFRLSSTRFPIILTALDKYSFLNDRRALRQMATNARKFMRRADFIPS